MDIVVAAIAVAAFAVTVLVLVGAANRAQRPRPRTVHDAAGEGWMTTAEVAALLGVSPAEVMAQVERDAIPHYILLGGRRSDSTAYRFRRDEVDAWTIG